MEYSIFRFTLNMHDHRSQASVSACRGDTAIRLCINITDGGNIYKIADGCVATLSGTKADGKQLWNPCVIQNNTIIYDFTDQTATCVGIANCEITLYDPDGGVITSPKFIIVVDEREVSGDMGVNLLNLSEDEYEAIDTVMGAAAAEQGRVEAEKVRVANEIERQASYKGKQDKLPVNTGSSSNRVWAATGSQYNGTTGVLIGTAKFKTAPILKENESPVITNIASITPSDEYTYALLARVAELYIMAGDDGTPKAYAEYIKASISGKTSVKFYWTYPYYFKRILAASQGKDASTATAGGPYVGYVTLKNYFTKWKNNEINSATPYDSNAATYKEYLKDYYQYHVCGGIGAEPTLTTEPKFSIFGVADNEEPFGETVAVRTADGYLVIESNNAPYHAVNNQRLELRLGEEVEKVNEEVDEKVSTIISRRFDEVFPNAAQAESENMSGWYRIAKTSSLTGQWSGIFHILANCRRSTLVTDVILSAQRMDYSSEPTIAILSTSSKRQDAPVLTNIRIVCTRPKDPVYATECYLDVYMSESPYGEGAWEDGTAKYDFTVETLFSSGKLGNGKWILLEPTLVTAKIEDPWISYEKDPLTSAWSKVTVSVDDINNLASKDYVDEKLAKIDVVSPETDEIKAIVDFVHPTMRVDLGEAAAVNTGLASLSIWTALKNAVAYECNYATGEVWGDPFPSDFGSQVTYNIKCVPDSVDYYEGARCNITSITVDLGKYASSYEVTNIDASRAIVSFWVENIYNDEGDIIERDIAIEFTAYVTLTIRMPNGQELKCSPEMYWGGWASNNLPIGICARILKNEETSIFQPSTYDLRTQSIDRQLAAAIEEARVRRKAEKANTGET